MDLSAPSGVVWRLNAERLVLLGWSRAILLQFAHPLIAAGVHDHSGFRVSPVAAIRRLRHTVRAMLALTFGDIERREAALEKIRAIHRRVHGELAEGVGPFPAGTRYSAEDPALVLWVHLTLLESVVLVYELLVRPLTEEDRDEYCASAAAIAIALGARDAEVPRTWRQLRASLDAAYQSGRIIVGPVARTLSAALLRPRGFGAVGPVAWMNEILTFGLLPDSVRRQYGCAWSPAQARMLRVAVRGVRVARRLAPDWMALWRESRDASARAARAEATSLGPSIRSRSGIL